MFFKIVNPDSLKIEHTYEASEPQQWGGAWGRFPHVAVPDGLDAECVRAISFDETVVVVDSPAVEEVLDPETGEVITPAQDAVTHEEQVTRYGLELDPALVAAKAQREKEALVGVAYQEMWSDVLAQMEEVYGTKSETSATANFLTWKEMIEAPAEFVGSKFADEAAVLAFAQPKVTAARAYGLWRDGRIDAFKAERAAILAEG